MKQVKIRNNTQKGFTLIELMITVAIVGILAAVALPAYQDYTIRAQVSEGLVISSGVQTEIADYYTEHGVLPANDNVLNVDMVTGKYARMNNVQNGVIVIFFNGTQASSKLANSSLALEAIPQSDGTIKWKCGAYAGLPGKWLPSSCQDTIDQNGPSAS